MHESPASWSPNLSRRALLAGGVAMALFGTGITRAEATVKSPATVADLISTDPFYIAHRGGGRNWPAMTAYAYSQAVKVPGIKALEISACLSSDGILVCSHNPTTTAMTGVPYTIAEQTWATLSQLQVLPTYTVDRTQPSRPMARFNEVAYRYIDDYVLFVEPKTAAAVQPLLSRMRQIGQPERVVWKQPINSKALTAAKELGFTTWGYALNEPAHLGDNLARFAAAADIDLLGAFDSESDDYVTAIVKTANDNGKSTIAWEISSVAERDRAMNLGCVGMMTSDVLNVVNAPL